MLTSRDLPMIRAALRFWFDEMSPHADETMIAYFDSGTDQVATGDEVANLLELLRGATLRYAVYDRNNQLLASQLLFESAEEAIACASATDAIATLLFEAGNR